MTIPSSIRWRLQSWYGALLVAVLGGFGVTAYHLEDIRLHGRIDAELQRLLPILVDAQHPAPGPDRQLREFTLHPRNAALFDRADGSAFYYVVWLRHSRTPVIRSATAPSDVAMPRLGDPAIRQRGPVREAFLFPGPGDCVLVGRSTATDTAGLHQLAWGLAAAGGLVLLLGMAVGSWLVRRALEPIREISEAAETIAHGDLTRRINTAETRSELGQLAGVLNSTFARLDAAFTQQARFTADAAHELRTPITILLAQAQDGLSVQCGNPEHRECLEAIQRAGQRMRRLIESLLALARLDAGQETFQKESLDLSQLAREGLERVQPLTIPNGVRLRGRLEPAPTVGDPERLGQALLNLLTNALQHSPHGGEVEVVTGTDESGAFLAVIDHGPGIAPEALPRLFERFYRTDPSRTRHTGGTGLGLSIARALVEAQGGRILVASQPGTGSRFTLCFPAAPTGPKPTATPASNPDGTPAG